MGGQNDSLEMRVLTSASRQQRTLFTVTQKLPLSVMTLTFAAADCAIYKIYIWTHTVSKYPLVAC
jgi:hypothetical protein